MAEVKWIKITTDMFDNRKIKHLRKLPDGNSIVLIWVMLLTMAGRCNASGMIFLTENIPYTSKMLADELGFEENTVILALEVLERFDMITRNEGVFAIAGWEEYQNIDGMEKIKEQTRLRVAKHRQKQKLLAGNVTCNVTVTESNETDIDKEIEIEKELEINNNIGEKPKRKRFVPPTIEDVKAYCQERNNNVDAERFVNYYTSNGWQVGKNKMKDWKAAVRTWEKNNYSPQAQNNTTETTKKSRYDFEEIQRRAFLNVSKRKDDDGI